MKLSITLSENDIKEALIAHAKKSLNVEIASEAVSVVITNGRKGNGTTAEIVIGSDDVEVTTPAVQEQSVAADAKTEATEVEEVAESTDVEAPAVTPETPGHESGEKTSLFD